jgi:hypothetical protein
MQEEKASDDPNGNCMDHALSNRFGVIEVPQKLELKEEHDLLMLRLNILSCIFSAGLSLRERLNVAFDYLILIYEEEHS